MFAESFSSYVSNKIHHFIKKTINLLNEKFLVFNIRNTIFMMKFQHNEISEIEQQKDVTSVISILYDKICSNNWILNFLLMNLVLCLKLLSIIICYHIKKICKIELINYLIESSISESIYTVVEHSFECWQKVSEVSIQSFF